MAAPRAASWVRACVRARSAGHWHAQFEGRGSVSVGLGCFFVTAPGIAWPVLPGRALDAAPASLYSIFYRDEHAANWRCAS